MVSLLLGGLNLYIKQWFEVFLKRRISTQSSSLADPAGPLFSERSTKRSVIIRLKSTSNLSFTIWQAVMSAAMHRFVIATVLCWCSMNLRYAYGMDFAASSPEPGPVDEGIYLYTAGFDAQYVSPVGDGMTICPSDFSTGINIRCVGDSSPARFFVNDVLVRTEYNPPFFLAGDVRGRVRAWAHPPTSATIKCKLFRPGRIYRATVTFQCWRWHEVLRNYIMYQFGIVIVYALPIRVRYFGGDIVILSFCIQGCSRFRKLSKLCVLNQLLCKDVDSNFALKLFPLMTIICSLWSYWLD